MRRMRSIWKGLAIILAVLSIVLLIAASPVVLHMIASKYDGWGTLGNVGEAYGGASAVLSGLALCGVVGSLLLQWRQARITQLYSARNHQLNLARLVLEKPEAMIIDGLAAAGDADAGTQIVINLWVANWATAWNLGTINEYSLRNCGKRLFESELARQWWRRWSETYADSAPGARFVEILTDECEKGAVTPSPVAVPEPLPRYESRGHRSTVGRIEFFGSVAAAVCALIAALGYLNRIRRRGRQR